MVSVSFPAPYDCTEASLKIIAEIGLSHEGSLGTALAYIDACGKAGVHAVKFQNHAGDRCNAFRTGTSFPQDATRADYWRRTSFKQSEWKRLSDHAHKCGLFFWVSVFSSEAVDMLKDVEVDVWKLGSGKIHDLALVAKCSGLWNTLALSTGLSDSAEVWTAIDVASAEEKYPDALRPSPIIFQCTSQYPCPAERIGLNFMRDVKERYPSLLVGLSDHSGTIWPSIVASREGANYCEVHVCFSRECFGPDVSSSITIDELRQLVQGVRFVERMTSANKDDTAAKLRDIREVFCSA